MNEVLELERSDTVIPGLHCTTYKQRKPRKLLKQYIVQDTDSLQYHPMCTQFAQTPGPDNGIGIVGNCPGPTTSTGPTKYGCTIF